MASISGNGSKGHHKFTLNVTENSTSTANNTSSVSFSFVLSPIQASWNWEQWGSSISYTVTINGTKYAGTIPNYDGYSAVTLKSESLTVAHNDDGKKTISYSFSVTDSTGQSYTCGNASASGTMALTNIPRYLSITSLELSNKTETSIVVSWKVSEPRTSTYYTLDNGATWIGSATYGESLASDGKSGTFNIKNLTANTAYKLKVKIKRTDSDLWTESGQLSFTTYNYPYCNSAPNFTIGNAVKIGFYNPLGRSIEWQILGADNSIIAGNATTGTSYTGINGEGSVANLYKSIPSAKSGTYKVKITYGSNIATKTGGTYSIKGTEKPTVGTINYVDSNTTATNITKNPQHIVQNKSNLKVTFGSATAKNSATIAKHTFELNGVTKTSTSASGAVDFGTINSANNLKLTVTVTDSRGLTASIEKEITMLAYSNPNALVTLERLNNYEDESYLTVDGSVASVNSKNTMTIKYRYKLSGGSYGSFVTIGDKAKQTLSLNKNNVYIFNVVVTDAFGSTYNKEFTLNKGVFPLFIDTGRNSIGINALPKRNKSLEIKEGQVYLEREEADTDAIYVARRIDTDRDIGFGVGKGGYNRGIYDYTYDKWVLKIDESGIYVNDIKINDNNFGDSGWKTVTFEGSFAHYNDQQTLKYRRVGKQVFIRGAMKPTAELGKDASHKAFTLPVGYRPAQMQDFLCQGSTANKWLCEITTAGVVSVARYGTTAYINIPTTAWLPVHISFLID